MQITSALLKYYSYFLGPVRGRGPTYLEDEEMIKQKGVSAYKHIYGVSVAGEVSEKRFSQDVLPVFRSRLMKGNR